MCTKQSVAETHGESCCRVLLCAVLLSLAAAGQWLDPSAVGKTAMGSYQSTVPLSALLTPWTLPATGKLLSVPHGVICIICYLYYHTGSCRPPTGIY